VLSKIIDCRLRNQNATRISNARSIDSRFGCDYQNPGRFTCCCVPGNKSISVLEASDAFGFACKTCGFRHGTRDDEFGGLEATGTSAGAICRNEHYPFSKMNDGDTILILWASDN